MFIMYLVEEWKEQQQLSSLGMPHYVASGSHLHKGNKYRFLILPRYKTDLESILEEKKRFNLKTVLTVSMQIIDILEYIHSKGYVHSDIKASNILLGCEKKKRPTRPPPTVQKPVFCYNRTCNPVRKCRIRDVRPVRSSRSKIFYLDDIPDFRAIEKLMEIDEVDEWKKLEKSLEIDQVSFYYKIFPFIECELWQHCNIANSYKLIIILIKERIFQRFSCFLDYKFYCQLTICLTQSFLSLIFMKGC